MIIDLIAPILQVVYQSIRSGRHVQPLGELYGIRKAAAYDLRVSILVLFSLENSANIGNPVEVVDLGITEQLHRVW